MIQRIGKSVRKVFEKAKNDWNRFLLGGGILLMLSGIFHLLVQAVSPRDWESPIGWRKPILFGISTGLTLVSLSWVVSIILPKKARLISAMIAVLACAEVAIITVQTWRGVPAHFNDGALIDRMLANSIDGMLVFITLGIFFITRRTFSSAPLGADWMAAIRLGMIFLSLSCLFGFGVAIYGNSMVSVGGNPELISPRGVPKFVHGMPLHAIQILPCWLFVLSFFNFNVRQREISVRLTALSIALITIYAIWQTLNGFGRFEPNFIGIILLICVGSSAAAAGGFVLAKNSTPR